MDRNNHYLLELIEFLKNRTEGPWELLATASGSEASIKKSLSCIAITELDLELQSKLSVAPSYVELRTEALTVSSPDIMRSYFKELKSVKNMNYWHKAAYHKLHNFFMRPEINHQSKPWRWHDYLNKPITSDDRLETRPFDPTNFTEEDFLRAIHNESALLRGLQLQHFPLPSTIFDEAVSLINTISPYTAARIVVISRNSDFNQDTWAKMLFDLLKEVKNPKHILPLPYVIINQNWLPLY